RAFGSHPRGQGFESLQVHQAEPGRSSRSRLGCFFLFCCPRFIANLFCNNAISKSREIADFTAFLRYLISCSNPRNNSELINSSIVIPIPSHSFLMVEIVALWLRPLTILFPVD